MRRGDRPSAREEWDSHRASSRSFLVAFPVSSRARFVRPARRAARRSLRDLGSRKSRIVRRSDSCSPSENVGATMRRRSG